MTPSTPDDLARMRREYAGTLVEEDLAPTWAAQFARWFADAVSAGLPEPNAMVLATADGQGRPRARTVLLKGYDERGFVFYTNYRSRKGRDIDDNPRVSAVFPWLPLHRQVIVEGAAEPVPRTESEDYFAVRPRGAQLGAWASPQSTVVASRAELEAVFVATEERFDGGPVPVPPHWGGYRILPTAVEFWQGRANRMHDRIRYRLDGDTTGTWIVERLAP